MVINCLEIEDKVVQQVKTQIELMNAHHKITLAILYSSANPATKLYIKNKENKAKSLGIKTRIIEVAEEEIEDRVLELNYDNSCNGIIVQLPLHTKKPLEIAKIIDPKKDVDGFHPFNVGMLSYSGISDSFVPCTALGCAHILQTCMNVAGKKILVIGRSNIVGKPLAYLLSSLNATVTLAHSMTQNLAEISRSCDAVVVAVGKPKYFGVEYFNKSSFVVDVGINHLDGKICGDVDFDSVKDYVAGITSVPRGVGPMTVAYLMHNTVKAYAMQNNFLSCFNKSII